jgi:2-polyprenyl-3-methyl-5-hydroxy-6-metoxy-1,4-benzoquinol methylase
MTKRFADSDAAHLEFCDQLSGTVLRIAGGDIERIVEDYRWLSAMVLEEELHFRREGKYRLSKFADALEQVYANTPFMAKYMNGLLASQLWWRNHTEVLRYFRDVFLPGNKKNFSHLEVGPGHGLFLTLAASAPNCASAEGWDISEASLDGTRAALKAAGAPGHISLKGVNIFEAPSGQFDSITFSEVLEHLEEPLAALKILRGLLAPGGRIFVNAPVNSPAPDHLYLFRTPEEVRDMVQAAGLDIIDTLYAPPSGASLEKARKQELSISAAVIACRPA